MSVAVLDGATVTGFMEAKGAFEDCVHGYFKLLDANGDGLISPEELRQGIGRLFTMEYRSRSKEEVEDFHKMIFQRFDEDRNGVIDRDEFRKLTEEIMLAMARGIGSVPVIVALDPDSLLMMAVKHEISRTSSKNIK